VFTVFTQGELPCNSAGHYDVNDTLRTFLSAGSVAGVNAVSMLGFTEIIINLREKKWGIPEKWQRVIIALLCLIVFWVWHAVALYWVAQGFMTGVISRGVFMALHISTYAVITAFTIAIAYKSSPKTFSTSKTNRHTRNIVSALAVGGLVVGVIAVGTLSGTRSLVPIIGDIPILRYVARSTFPLHRHRTYTRPASQHRVNNLVLRIIYEPYTRIIEKMGAWCAAAVQKHTSLPYADECGVGGSKQPLHRRRVGPTYRHVVDCVFSGVLSILRGILLVSKAAAGN